ncbi:DNA-binding transcriptional MerR regulator [Thermocatellispora tengchongensis]|uniref:DNA-binding transcriptional MerR regulator n=1 Tax=Thermocatellispora tengchongensis TaxID=1073253 RepID=A0A840P083_9ACTN|nr:MerR family transcriptional regulator [Thermocatellispora tengchongensis]MBB5134614.1 DNA-binding transcriptional MerR regulator [Thermocatellispora tengchongensis]
MFSIGDFARLGQVSVRSLRHYDALGLLVPAHVDPASGYRYYRAAQLARLNRIVALLELGFTLRQVAVMIDGELEPAELEGMLRLRRAELEAKVAADLERINRVEARIRLIHREGATPSGEIRVKRLPALRVVRLGATVGGWEPREIGEVIVPLFEQVYQRLERAGLQPGRGPMLACYQPEPDGVGVHAAVPAPGIAATQAAAAGLEAADLPEVDAATLVHRGPMEHAGAAWQEIAHWLEAHGRRFAGPAREVYLECPGGGDRQVTELQQPIVKQPR